MISPLIPANDAERVAQLRALGVLDTPPEPDYDELTRLAALVCQVPVALISLVDSDRQWFKSRLGLASTETSRDISFCAHAINEPRREFFVVPDAHLDPRFADNPSVLGEPHIRFYAGTPLITHDGWALGTLCVIDRRPRELTPDQLSALSALRRHVINALELRRLVDNQNRIITDLEETRRSLDTARRVAEEATRAKTEFLATMSHEIRTPMNAVLGMTTLLRDTALTPDQRDYVDTLQTSGEHLLTVINDILDFSKIEAGKLALDYVDFSLAQCTAAAVRLLAARALEKGLRLRTEFAPDLPDLVSGDVTRVRQILVNLLANAVKFTDHGEIAVHVSGRPLPDGHHEITFTVRDTGIGIPPARLGQLFQNFAQAEASTSRHYGGTGLGLAISRRLAELHGGNIGCESTPGQGSRFHFTVIVHAPAGTPRPVGSSNSPLAAPSLFDAQLATRHPARILVADDNPVNREVLGRILRKLGYTPAFASDGRSAVAALHAGSFDLVLMDIEMPDLNGPAATRLLRAELPAARQPVVVAVTAHALDGSHEAFLASGMDEVLTKPIRVPELVSVLRRLDQLRRAPKTA
jgi:signal transduction histidine kinase/ActR/RegA family two-component response regulator